MRRSIFEGSTAAVVIPMDEYGDPDLDTMGRLLNWLLEEKTDAVAVNGVTGEFATLDDNEKMEVIDFVIRHVNGRIPVIADTGDNYTERAVKLSREAGELGADTLLQVTPYCNRASQEGLVRHFIQVGDHVRIPMILYNVSSHTGVTMQPEAHRILSERPNIRGAKGAGGNMSMIAKAATLCGDGFNVYSGNDSQTIPIMILRGKGVISVLANIMSKQAHDMRRLFLEGKLEESGKMQLYPLDIVETLFWDVNPIPVKTVLSIMGMCIDSHHLPLTPMKAGEKTKLGTVMKRYR